MTNTQCALLFELEALASDLWQEESTVWASTRLDNIIASITSQSAGERAAKTDDVRLCCGSPSNCGAACVERGRWMERQSSLLTAQSPARQEPPKVELPERVIDCLWQNAGLCTFHPDGSQQDKFYEFAHAVTSEVLARLPAPIAPPSNELSGIPGELTAMPEGSVSDASVAAIEFALTADDGLTFLRLWNEGSFDVIRKE